MDNVIYTYTYHIDELALGRPSERGNVWFDEFSDQFDNEYKKKRSINVLFAYQGVDPHLGLVFCSSFFLARWSNLEGATCWMVVEESDSGIERQ